MLPDETLVGLVLGESDSSPDQGLATRETRHKEAAFETLVKRHSESIRRVIKAIISDPAQVDDVEQETFASAFRSLSRLKDRTKFKYWLRMIAINEANDLSRAASAFVPADDKLEYLLTLPERDLGPTPAEAAEAAWLIEELSCRLPREYMRILYLRYYLDYTVSQVAELLGINPGLVRWRTSRAKKLAADALKASDVATQGEDASPKVQFGDPPDAGSRIAEEEIEDG